jgi:type IV pilus assembly protein PilP
MTHSKRFVLALLTVLATGCSNDGLDDLREFVKNAHADRKPRVEPIPEIKPQEGFIYAASKLPDPFAGFNLRAEKANAKGNGLRPDMNRRKQALEEFPLDALKMVGTLSRGKQFWAVIQAPDGTVHRTQVGNYLGQNFGAIVKITEEKIDLIELIPGSVGDWVEREASISIAAE